MPGMYLNLRLNFLLLQILMLYEDSQKNEVQEEKYAK